MTRSPDEPYKLGLYILRGRLAVPVQTVEEWGRWFGTHDRHVADDIIGGCRISTVFIGIDHSFGAGDLPILFETMTFEPPDGDEVACERCGTWEEAVEMHEAAVAQVIAMAVRAGRDQT
jgi:hypothetical protein